MRRIVLAIAVFAFAVSAFAQRVDELNGRHVQLHPTNGNAADQEPGWAKPGGGGAQNLSYHGGPVITHAKVVSIFWGSQWGTNGNPNSTALNMLQFFASFGTTPEYNTITEYSGIQKNNLTNTYWVDTANPPTNVSDAAIQAEVVKYITTNGVDASTIYEVFLPSTSYSSYGNQDSCGGPNLVYCAYHSNFSHNGVDVKYASMPYPSCSGCQASGFSTVQNFQHFACHETREAVTDPDGNAWYDRRGNEADDKCAWSPAPFIGTGGFGYQYEWSNAVSGCVRTK